MYVHHGKIGGIGKTVEIGESKFGKGKYYKGHHVEGQWVFGGIEHESGRSFLVPVDKCDVQTLLPIILEWIEPGTTIVSHCFEAFDCLEENGYHHLNVNQSAYNKDPLAGAHSNSMESIWCHAKAFLPKHSRKKHFLRGNLAKFLFLRECEADNSDPLTEFFHIASEVYEPVTKQIFGDESDSSDSE